MSTAIGQTIRDVLTVRDETQAPVLLLTDADFATLEAFSIETPATTAAVALAEIDGGQYAASFIPTTGGAWALHYVYDATPVFREETRRYDVAETADVVVVTAGGTWTYEGDFGSARDRIRFALQDTAGDNPLFTDEEIAYALGAASDDEAAVGVALTRRLVARYAAMADTEDGELKVKASQLYDHYAALLASFTDPFAGGSLSGVAPYAGGISLGDVQGRQANRDRIPGIFERDARVPGYRRAGVAW